MGVVRRIQSSYYGPAAAPVWWVSGFQVLQQQQGQNIRAPRSNLWVREDSENIPPPSLWAEQDNAHVFVNHCTKAGPGVTGHCLSCHITPGGSRQFTEIIPANLITARMPPYQGHWHPGHQVSLLIFVGSELWPWRGLTKGDRTNDGPGPVLSKHSGIFSDSG